MSTRCQHRAPPNAHGQVRTSSAQPGYLVPDIVESKIVARTRVGVGGGCSGQQHNGWAEGQRSLGPDVSSRSAAPLPRTRHRQAGLGASGQIRSHAATRADPGGGGE